MALAGAIALSFIRIARGEVRCTADMDFRLRHLWLNADDTATVSETRLRLDAEVAARVSDTVTTTIGLGFHREGAPVAAEVPLGGNFTDKPLAVRRAELAWRPEMATGLTLLAGKIAPPWARPSDLVWDEDVRPEGGAARWIRQFGAFDAMATAGAFILRDDAFAGGNESVRLYAVQTAIRHRWPDRSHAVAGVGWYSADAPWPSQEVDNRESVSAPAPELRPPTAEVRRRPVEAFAAGTWELYFPVRGVVHYVFNPETERAQEGWLIGLTVGRTTAINSVEIGWQWRRIERDAAFPEFADDMLWPGADRSEHRFRIAYRPMAGVLVSLTLSEGRRLAGPEADGLRGAVLEARIEY